MLFYITQKYRMAQVFYDQNTNEYYYYNNENDDDMYYDYENGELKDEGIDLVPDEENNTLDYNIKPVKNAKIQRGIDPNRRKYDSQQYNDGQYEYEQSVSKSSRNNKRRKKDEESESESSSESSSSEYSSSSESSSSEY